MFRSILLAASLALAGCATTTATTVPPTSTVGGVVAKAGTVVLTGQRGFAVAEIAYTQSANGVALLVDHGIIKGQTASRIRTLNARAREILVKGKAASDMATKARYAAELFGISNDFDRFSGKVN